MITMPQTSQREKITFSNQAAWQALFQVLGASGFLALCSQIKIVLPFTLVPLTLQTLAVLLIGATLGSRKVTWAILLYFAEILAGFPVLAGGVSDPLVFLGPTGGYVLGFCLQAFIIGWMVEKMPWSKPVTLLVGGLLACSAEMGLGIWALAHFIGWGHVWTMGLFPFVPGEILKVLFVSWVLNSRNISCTKMSCLNLN